MPKIELAYRFVESWIDRHIRDASAQPNVSNSSKMAKQCWADAEKAGISAGSIKSAIGDLPAYLAEALGD